MPPACHAPRERVSWNGRNVPMINNYRQSRSTWACELKCQQFKQPWRPRRVTLHVSVWVEIFCFRSPDSAMASRSTWACELKFFEKMQAFCWPCHAPRERVSWNSRADRFFLQRTSHAPRERVSWNCYDRNGRPYERRHAPRERVSWNIYIRPLREVLKMSRSTWACELKFLAILCKDFFWGHAPRERVSWNRAIELEEANINPV